jgi:serine/threonine-protein kinase
MQGKHGFTKLVAVKTILPQYASDIRFQQMFLDEARIASGIEHTNVAQILDLGEEHDVLYIIMEWVDGDALNKLHRALEKKELTIPHGIVARIVADACGGLHAAHEMRDRDGSLLGVVHRDVSPHNILVSAKGVAKVIDFGIAKARDRLSGDTHTGFLKGKIQYMAPEQALGKQMDRRADVWALGAILYHLYSGRPPYDGPNQLATLHLLTSGKPPLPLPASVPAPLSAVVRRALSADPAQRFETAAEMQRALEGAMVDAGVSTTTSDVAAFTVQHLTDRAEARKKAIDLAFEAAAERHRMQKLLVPPSPESSPGVSDVEKKANARVRSLSMAPIEEVVPFRPSGAMTVADSPLRQKSRREAEAVPHSDHSTGTLGLATVETFGQPLLPRNRRGVAVAIGAIAAIAIAAFVSTRGSSSARPAAAAAEAPPAETPIPAAPAPQIPPIPSAEPAVTPSAASATPTSSSTRSEPKPRGVRVAPAPRPPPPVTTSSPKSTPRRSVDDGF